ncbi:hypothetical protein JCM10213_001155 [Rhodosporidiobolus nylandii]
MSWRRPSNVNDARLNDADEACATQHLQDAFKHTLRAREEAWETAHHLEYAARHEVNVLRRTARDGAQNIAEGFEGGVTEGSAAPTSWRLQRLGREASGLLQQTRRSPLVLKSQQEAERTRNAVPSRHPQRDEAVAKGFAEAAGLGLLTGGVVGLYNTVFDHDRSPTSVRSHSVQPISPDDEERGREVKKAAGIAGIVAADLGLIGLGMEVGRRRERSRGRSGTGLYTPEH